MYSPLASTVTVWKHINAHHSNIRRLILINHCSAVWLSGGIISLNISIKCVGLACCLSFLKWALTAPLFMCLRSEHALGHLFSPKYDPSRSCSTRPMHIIYFSAASLLISTRERWHWRAVSLAPGGVCFSWFQIMVFIFSVISEPLSQRPRKSK